MCEARRKWVESSAGKELPYLKGWWSPHSDTTTDELHGLIECPIGMSRIPVGMGGPLLFNGTNVKDYVVAPIATTEGAMVASATRGSRAFNGSNGVVTCVVKETISQSPMFVTSNVKQADMLSKWLQSKQEFIQRVIVARYSDKVTLSKLKPFIDCETLHMLHVFTTSDDCVVDYDLNILTHAISKDIATWVEETVPLELPYVDITASWAYSGLVGDRKPVQHNSMASRGIAVAAEGYISKHHLAKYLKTSAAKLYETWMLARRANTRSCTIGTTANASNLVTAIFIATGQNLGYISESSVCYTSIEKDSNGGVQVKVDMPQVMLSLKGGAVNLPTQRDCLRIIACEGQDKTRRLAEIIAGFTMALEVSLISAVSAGHFAEAHDRLGRNRPKE
ncbi:unnamed protein product [Owenia fusiformis]|nr:unnamed protein product [Owenia fusiformis]